MNSCSENAHKGFKQGRRDVFENIFYVLIYFPSLFALTKNKSKQS